MWWLYYLLIFGTVVRTRTEPDKMMAKDISVAIKVLVKQMLVPIRVTAMVCWPLGTHK